MSRSSASAPLMRLCVSLACVVIILSRLLQLSSTAASLSDNSSNINNASLSRLDSFVRRMMECRQIPGLTLTVVKLSDSTDQSTVTRRQYGWADVERRTPMTEHTRVCIASLTKAFSTALLGMLMSKTRTGGTRQTSYDWDSRLVDILSDYDGSMFDNPWISDHVTLRDVMTHRTGVSRPYDELWVANAFNKTDIIKRIKAMKVDDEFRSESHYNNVIYSLVGHVIERLAENGYRVTWEQLMEELVLDRLNMTETSFYHDRRHVELFAKHYVHHRVDNKTESVLFDHRLLSAGSASIASSVSLCTTGNDIAHWLRQLLASEQCRHSNSCQDDDGVLPGWVVGDMFRPHVIATNMFYSMLKRPQAKEPLIIDGYGLGWLTGHYRGHDLAMHYGSLIGAYSMITVIPSARLGLFSSYNGAEQNDPYTLSALLHTFIADIYLVPDVEQQQRPDDDTWWCDVQPYPPRTSAFQTAAAALNSSSSDDIPLIWSRYTGFFEHPVLGTLDISATSCNDGDFRSAESCTGVTTSLPTTMLLVARYGQMKFQLKSTTSMTLFEAVPIDSSWQLVLGNFAVEFSNILDYPSVGRRYSKVDFSMLSNTVFRRSDIVETSTNAAVRQWCELSLMWFGCLLSSHLLVTADRFSV